VRLTDTTPNDRRAWEILNQRMGVESLHDVLVAAILRLDGQTPSTDRAMATALAAMIDRVEAIADRLEKLEVGAPAARKGRTLKSKIEQSAREFGQQLFDD
jgi:hypothetical protein